jgi:ABC-2 type transport system ATP-binding protein
VERAGAAPGGELLRALYAAGVPVADVETRRSRLEDVMLEVLRGRPAA